MNDLPLLDGQEVQIVTVFCLVGFVPNSELPIWEIRVAGDL